MPSDFSSQMQLPRHAQQSWLSRLLAFLLSTGLLILGFMFSLVALAIVALAGAILGGWLWWKSRQLRKEMGQRTKSSDGMTIEGEAINSDGDLTTSYRRLE